MSKDLCETSWQKRLKNLAKDLTKVLRFDKYFIYLIAFVYLYLLESSFVFVYYIFLGPKPCLHAKT